MPEYDDIGGFYSFDEDWRNWIDSPPLNWAPPKGATLIWSHTYDSRETRDPSQDGFFYVVRLDAWPGDLGITMHFRCVYVFIFQDPNDPDKIQAFNQKSVTSFVLPWGVRARFEEWMLDPSKQKKPNGKGKKHKGDDPL